MPDKVITSVDQVTTEWLTLVLSKNGALTRGNVILFDLGTGKGNWSTSGTLGLQYSEDAIGTLPKKLFLKMVDTDLGDEFFGNSEVTFYTRDYLDVKDAPLLRCYDAVYSEELKRYHILLEDVSESHVEALEKEPTLEYGFALAEGFAKLHARWWGAERLVEARAPIHPAEYIQRFVDIAAPGVEPILNQFSAELKPHWAGLMKRLFDKHPQEMIKRAQNPSGFTLIHGDAGCSNILVPRVGDRPLYLIDRQPFNWSLTTWLGVYDLAYAIVLDWSIESRRSCEMQILKHYHAHLLKNGVVDYSWEQLYADYQLCAGMCVYIAVEYCRGGVNERWVKVWMPMLQNALTACDDLKVLPD